MTEELVNSYYNVGFVKKYTPILIFNIKMWSRQIFLRVGWRQELVGIFLL